MDLFDFVPLWPSGMSGGRSSRSSGEQLAAGVATLILPAVSFVLVLFAGVAPHTEVALVVLPLASGALAFALARLLSTSGGRSILLAFLCAVYCFTANGAAVLLAALGQFYSSF